MVLSRDRFQSVPAPELAPASDPAHTPQSIAEIGAGLALLSLEAEHQHRRIFSAIVAASVVSTLVTLAAIAACAFAWWTLAGPIIGS